MPSRGALEPGTVLSVRLKLNDCGYAFAPGHRVRLARLDAYWPLIWPAPENASLTLRLPARLVLPARPPHARDGVISFEPPLRGKDAPVTRLAQGRMTRSTTLDLVNGNATYSTKSEGGLFGEGAYRFDEIDTSVSHDLAREPHHRGRRSAQRALRAHPKI